MAAPPSASVVADAIEREVALRLRPDPELLERLAATRTALIERAEGEARRMNIPLVRCIIAGSAARGTFLNDRIDIDCFLLFPPETPREELERHGLALGRALLEAPQMRYAEHPYLRGTFQGFTVETVPGFAIKDPAHPLSAVDRTPFHQEYLTQRQTPAMVSDVRLLKQFLRALGIYGSEARTAGFSGYLVELLILEFGSLRGVLTAARSWRIPVLIGAGRTPPPGVPEEVAIVLVDPVDPHRNVATALSRRNLGLLILAAGEYLDHPDRRAFELPPPSNLPRAVAVDRVARRGTFVLAVELDRPDLVDDVLYPQIRKAARALATEAERLGFDVVGTASSAGERRALILLETTSSQLAPVEVRRGPPAGIDRTGEFLAKWTTPGVPVLQGPYVTDQGHLAVEVPRRTTGLPELLRESLPKLPLGKDLREHVASARVVPLTEVTEGPELEGALAYLLAKELPWRRWNSGD
ncbi:MAG: CCA tRNA nucleotidyltransferase [Thermoplasmata archaeon]|nr:CCA tRNA nucleotidyltransferase [Thermoplasmata archaeon]